MRIGAHVSVSKGYRSAIDYALEVGCECIQIFAKSPRQWRAKEIDPEKAREFIAYRQEQSFGPVFTHTAYLINLATPDEALRDKSIIALADELERGKALAVDGVVTHTGSGRGEDPQATLRRVVESLEAVLALVEAKDCPPLLLENTAGAGDSFGGDFAQLGEAMRSVEPAGPARLGVCVDTCHAHAAGIPVGSDEDWSRLADEVATECGSDAWQAIHANDCVAELGSHRDRHAWIGDGMIGYDGFRAMLACDSLRDVPAITEMPGEVPEKDAENILRLQSMREST